MDMNCSNSWQVVFAPQTKENQALDDFLSNFFEVVMIDYTDDGKVRYTGCLKEPVDEKELLKKAAQEGIELPEFLSEFIPAQNWLTANVIKFPPLETKDFFIYGTHEDNPPATSKHQLKIYAATAFGSGQHQTTRLCLQLLSLLNRRGFRGVNVLDMGCGSGILGLCALELWKNAVVMGVDIDSEAVAVSLENAKSNRLEKRFYAVESEGFANPQIKSRRPYGMIFANILARPLIDMAQDISYYLVRGGYAILSGFTDEQSEWVTTAYKEQGFRLIKSVADENWRAVLLEKIK
ncbi:MAG: 50S ribosomal protein L11 methyltransferase [Alphaproteobacteria bacterium]|nr:50S ribosomal protein L11 methyltransferase [Alphaproteobacteria bacterium]